MKYVELKSFCKKSNTPEAIQIYNDVFNLHYNKKELKDWILQFNTLDDELDMWYYDFEAKERKFIKVKFSAYTNNGYGYDLFMKNNFNSTIEFPINIHIDHNIRLITSNPSIDFGLDDNFHLSRFEVQAIPKLFKKDNIDFSKLSHIYKITDISDNEVEIECVTKDILFSIISKLGIQPIAVNKLKEE